MHNSLYSLIRLSVSNNTLFRSVVLALTTTARKYIQTICYVLYYSFHISFFSAPYSISRPFPFYVFPFLFIELIIFGFNMVAPRQKKIHNNINNRSLKIAHHNRPCRVEWGGTEREKVLDIPRIPIRIGENELLKREILILII